MASESLQRESWGCNFSHSERKEERRDSEVHMFSVGMPAGHVWGGMDVTGDRKEKAS